MAIWESILVSLGILVTGGSLLVVLNYYIQRRRAKKWAEQGFDSVISRGFSIEKTADKFKVKSDESVSVLFGTQVSTGVFYFTGKFYIFPYNKGKFI